MQVEVDVKCMQTNFGGCGLSSFKVYLKSTLLLQIPHHITTVIHLLHISHFFIFLGQMAAAKNLMKVKAKISLTKFPRLTVYQISLSI